MQILKFDGLTDMSDIEMQQVEGGLVPPVIAVAGLVLAGGGVLLAGVAVGYGVYCLVDWVTSK